MPRSERFHGLAARVSRARRHGLGDAAFDTAKLRLEGTTGIPYTGTGATAAELDAARAALIPIANGDLNATIAALDYPDPFVAKIALDYLKRAADDLGSGWQRLVAGDAIAPALYQRVTGRALNTDPSWRYGRESKVLATIFPILGGIGGVIQGSDNRVHISYGGEVLWDQSIYDDNYDFGALRQSAQRWLSAHPQTGSGPSQEAIDRVNQSVPTPTDPNQPPSGWRPGDLDGKPGWWAPDGLWYVGATPWKDYTPGTGKSFTPTSSSGGTPAGGSGSSSGGTGSSTDSGAGGGAAPAVVPWHTGDPVGQPPAAPVLMADDSQPDAGDPDYLHPGGSDGATRGGTILTRRADAGEVSSSGSSATKWIIGGVAATAAVAAIAHLLRPSKRSRK